MKWQGVMPAITTCFDQNDKVDHAFMARHCRWLVENGCTGVVALGSLGDNDRGADGAPLTVGEWALLLDDIIAQGVTDAKLDGEDQDSGISPELAAAVSNG